MSYFYFDQMFRTALSGINGTSVMPTIIQIASAILLATLLFNVYEAFVRGGDVRTLAIGAVKYFIIGLIFLNPLLGLAVAGSQQDELHVPRQEPVHAVGEDVEALLGGEPPDGREDRHAGVGGEVRLVLQRGLAHLLPR